MCEVTSSDTKEAMNLTSTLSAMEYTAWETKSDWRAAMVYLEGLHVYHSPVEGSAILM